MFSSIYKTVTYPAKLYQDINPATLSGAIDIIVVKQKNGDLNSSPFHVRFGKIKIVRPSEKSVLITVNGVPSLFSMKLGDQGEAFFVVETNEIVPHEFKTSPIISPGSNFDEVSYFNFSQMILI